jgi:hypothetical protein
VVFFHGSPSKLVWFLLIATIVFHLGLYLFVTKRQSHNFLSPQTWETHHFAARSSGKPEKSPQLNLPLLALISLISATWGFPDFPFKLSFGSVVLDVMFYPVYGCFCD